jgi:hypothetical protein
MPAEDTLRDAEYGLTMIKQNLGTDRLQYHLKAFLTSLKSVFDYLLEDYNKKYSLEITEDEDLTEKRFEERARRLRHDEAQRFIAWWKAKKQQVRSDRRCAFLLDRHGRRDLIVHRKRIPMRADVQVFDTATATVTVRVEKYDKQGTLYEVSESEPAEPAQAPTPKPSTIEFYFDGFDIENIVSVCKHCIETLKNVIEEARRNFPL